jgi:PKD repeat protein
MSFNFEVTPPPQVNFYYYPGDPSVFDTVQFYDNTWDPGGVGVQTQIWDFGDGVTAEGCCPSHRYAADGSYTVTLTVTTIDGRTGSASQTVTVMTHDVAITRFAAPNAASAGQTRQVVVGVNSRRYVEQVSVDLYKSVPGGDEWVGALSQEVPVRPSNRTTDFNFSYTFTPGDALLGKITFRAVATIQNGRDVLPADNEAIAPPTKVK